MLLPSFLGCLLLLFGSSLSAYATAEALTSGTIPLTSIQIGSFLNGNVLAGQQNVGKALGLGLVIIIAIVMVIYVVLQRGRRDGCYRPRSPAGRTGRRRAGASGGRGRGGTPSGQRDGFRPWRWLILILAGVYFILPLYAALRFAGWASFRRSSTSPGSRPPWGSRSGSRPSPL